MVVWGVAGRIIRVLLPPCAEEFTVQFVIQVFSGRGHTHGNFADWVVWNFLLVKTFTDWLKYGPSVKAKAECYKA